MNVLAEGVRIDWNIDLNDLLPKRSCTKQILYRRDFSCRRYYTEDELRRMELALNGCCIEKTSHEM
jgi:hypothetical protein